ncbi:MATE family efflux transporter [Clostridium sp. NSJ-6]|uniref:Multidrug export protein MepA n=1 Tax=Clostridium hominis TaxID=2763036 RepID=A0ABR7DCL0_9CLOT|nr:MATE family efflux transporter [Clostridium hominis]MBC5629119.1 MATE family efflux transporter [Clostridium hominis]MDU2671821.1 MATE family efflux transporter [Clostridium sp.]
MTDTKTLRKSFFRNLIPSVTAMWVYSIYTIIDGIFVGKGVGSTALASVNIAMPFVNLIFASSIFFATGTSTLISIRLGQNKKDEANNIFSFNVAIMIIFSIVLLILSLLFIDKISLFLGATESTFEMVKEYLSIIVIFNGFFIVSYCLEVLTKADGFPNLAIIGVSISAVANIILDYLFVMKFGWGVRGAAIATGISQVASCLFFTLHFLKPISTLKFIKFRPSFNIFRRIIGIGFPDGITELTSGIVILIFNQSILKFIGENGLVTYSVICYVSTLVLMTMIGITQGAQPLCSFYYGSDDVKSLKYLFNITLKTIAIVSIGIFIICIIFAPAIINVFITSNDINLINQSIIIFRIYSLSFLLVGFNILSSGFCSSIESPMLATLISISRGLIIIVITLIITIILYGGKGIWIATILSEAICLLISLWSIKISFKNLIR